MKKVGILGGTFNPPHIGHLIIANEVLSALSLDSIWFMPNQEPPHKRKEGDVTNEQRVEMLELAIKGHPCFRVESIELERSGPSYTYDTMKLLTERHGDKEFYFIIGADMIEYLPKWHKVDELQNLLTFVGVNRPAYSSETKYDILYVESPMMELSSSLIRKRIGDNQTIRYLIPDSVRLYIEENQLYGS
ncbi:nicotinate-nucleotide adenylyltransferase [Mesobacillus foraminis]|uniref:Probable nicotinate-nucleotide adenylyltransferase n=1 Tax=Mesobacillus foraminis TaxID=279826 RepID=A0A4R2BFI7_9BACI|nr:nicotinate-nucleotide adenylyltransferase [Mesobacillus foraminis]TCN24634.1 nicotinate-nucleotide adenylyltransferase [Mesobacillus foraminis]